MRFAILSDIHSNLEALEAVLADARAQSCTQFVCLGDVVGYNANPSECVKIIQELECPVVKGNHDEQASIVASTEAFNELAEEAIDWTRAQLSAADIAWLADLSLTRQVGDFTIVHATLDSPGQWGYIFNDLDAMASFTCQHTPLCFFGHTHWPTAFVRDDDAVRRIAVGRIVLTPGKNISSIPAASASRAIATGAPPTASSTPTARSSSNGVSNTTSRLRRTKSVRQAFPTVSPTGCRSAGRPRRSSVTVTPSGASESSDLLEFPLTFRHRILRPHPG